MKKTELPLSSITPTKGEPRPARNCDAVRQEVNNQLLTQSAEKFNKLKHCNSCTIEDPRLPVINSPADAQLLNTGFDGKGGKLDPTNLNNNTKDLLWEAGKGTPSTQPTTWIPATVFKSGAWVDSPFNNANWISFYENGRHDESVDIYFRCRFYLNGSVDPSQFVLDMDFYADNCVHEIFVNGQAQSVNYPSILPQDASDPYHYRGFDAGKQVHIALGKDWKACENEIVVQVKSGIPLIGFLAQNAFRCLPSKMPELAPVLNISWGDSDCDCLETDDYEVMYITACNPYADVTFSNFVINKLTVLDELGQPVALLPDGTSSIELRPAGPYCFGDLQPCSEERNNCVAREFVLFNRGAKSGKYKIVIEGICFELVKKQIQSACFEMMLCKS